MANVSSQVHWEKTISEVNDEILVNLEKPHQSFYVALGMAASLLLAGVVFVGLHTVYGLGLWVTCFKAPYLGSDRVRTVGVWGLRRR